MKIWSWLLPLLSVVICSTAIDAAPLNPSWSQATVGHVDGLGTGDLDGDGLAEIVSIERGGAYAPNHVTPGVGSVVARDRLGQVLWTFQTGDELVGSPVLADFDGDGLDEVAFCGATDASACIALDGDGSILFQSSTQFYYGGFTNGGPSAADVNQDGFDDLIVASFGGEVALLYGPMGAQSWLTDLWAINTELILSHAAVADVDHDKNLEIVVAGWCQPAYCGSYGNAGLYVIDATTGGIEWQINSLYNLYQAIPEYSGPAVLDLDGDQQLEIVLTLASQTVSTVVAYQSSGAFLWQTDLVGLDVRFTSPIGVNLQGDLTPEIAVMGFNGGVFTLDSTGGILNRRRIDNLSWSSMSIVDTAIDLRPELLVSTVSGLRVLQGSDLSTIDQYTNTGANVFPPPVVSDIDRDQQMELVVGTWSPPQLHYFDTSYLPINVWSQLMGRNHRNGALATKDKMDGSISESFYVVSNDHQALINDPSTPAGALTRLNQAKGEIDRGWRDYLRGNPHTAADRLRRAVRRLRQAQSSGADTLWLQNEVCELAIQLLIEYADRAASVMGQNNASVVAARQEIVTAQSEQANGQYWNCIRTVDDATLALRNAVDNFNYTSNMVNDCSQPLVDTYHYWECELLLIWDDVTALRDANPGDGQLQNGWQRLVNAISWTPDVVLGNVGNHLQASENHLANATVNTSAERQAMTTIFGEYTRLFIFDATVMQGATDPDIISANNNYNSGITELGLGNYQQALQFFTSAVNDARP